MKLLQIPGLTAPEMPADSIAAAKEQSVEMLKSLSFDDLINKLAYDVAQFAIHLAIAIFVFYIGKFIIGKLYRLVHNVMVGRNVDKSLTTFVLSLVRIVLYFILIVTVIGIAIMTVGGLLLFLLADPLIRLFTPDEEAILLGAQVLRIVAFAEPFFAMSIVVTGVLRGAGDTRAPFLKRIFRLNISRSFFGSGEEAAYGKKFL